MSEVALKKTSHSGGTYQDAMFLQSNFGLSETSFFDSDSTII